MRFAGQAITIPSVRQNPEVIPSTEGVRYPEDNQPAGEFNGGQGVDPTYLPQMRDRFIQSPRGGVTMLPNGEQGPSQGPNTPIKNYDGQYMPDGTQPTGYQPPVRTAQLAPQMTDPWVENSMIQDYDSPYLVTPDIKRLRRGSMNQFIDNPEVLKRTFKGV